MVLLGENVGWISLHLFQALQVKFYLRVYIKVYEIY